MPDDRPRDNDQRFSYYANVTRWGTCQVAEERTTRVATDKFKLWLDTPDQPITFPPTQEDVSLQQLRSNLAKERKSDNLRYLLIQTQQKQSSLRKKPMRQELRNQVRNLELGTDDHEP